MPDAARTLRGAAAACAGVAVAWFVLAPLAARMGPREQRGEDALLDRFIPEYDVEERHEIEIAAPAAVTYGAARSVGLQQSALVRAILRGRELLMRAPHDAASRPESLVAETIRLGWRVLAEEPGRELVMGAVTEPWQANVTFRPLAPETFAAFAEPGHAKIAWTMSAEPLGEQRSRFRTITRVRTTDAVSRRRFRRYWSVFSPGIRLIRIAMVRLVRSAAERSYRDARAA